jgi:ribonucleoside-diphosphate reductase beta chain
MSVIKLKKDKEVFKGGLLVENPVYKPFRYPWCYDAWLTQQRIHWLPEEVPLGDDVRDWQKNLSQEEKNLLTQIFRFFTQADVEVSNGNSSYRCILTLIGHNWYAGVRIFCFYEI